MVDTYFAREYPALQPGFDALLDLVPNFAKLGQLFLICAFEGCRILEGSVQALVDSRPDRWTVLVGVIANGNKAMEQDFSEIGIHTFGSLIRYIDPDFLQSLDSEGIDTGGFQPDAVQRDFHLGMKYRNTPFH